MFLQYRISFVKLINKPHKKCFSKKLIFNQHIQNRSEIYRFRRAKRSEFYLFVGLNFFTMLVLVLKLLYKTKDIRMYCVLRFPSSIQAIYVSKKFVFFTRQNYKILLVKTCFELYTFFIYSISLKNRGLIQFSLCIRRFHIFIYHYLYGQL